MKVSLNWLREFLPLDKTNAEISDLLTFAGVEVEGIEERGVNIASVVVAQILSSEQHPNADRLSVCKVDDGSGLPRQIVCGAKNYQVGDKIPLALPGAVLPGDFKIKVGKLRGVESEGMMCSAKELGISEESAGLLILPPDASIGTAIGELFPADTLFDLEITPNRPDLLSHRGIARELAAIMGDQPLSFVDEELASPLHFVYASTDDDSGSRTIEEAHAALENLLRSAVDVSRRSAGADASERIRAEAESLLQWAGENGWLLESGAFGDRLEAAEELEAGQEHLVWKDEGSARVIKMTIPPNFGARGELQTYLKNIIASNRLFEDDIRFEGILETAGGAMVVTSQPFIAGDSPTETEIVDWMRKQGFTSLGFDIFEDAAGTKLADARPANIIKSGGNLYPIDVHIFEKTSGTKPVEWPQPSFPVRIESNSAPFYSGRIVRNVKIGPSPEWLVRKLQAVGLRSINNVVDVTNFVMLEMGQPLHAFDLAKVHGGILVRNAAADEKFLALDGREYHLTPLDLVIADEIRALAIAGVMGGLDSGVSDTTTDILLESAFFRSSNIRRTSRVLGLASDSSYRFERGVDPGQLLAASARACQLLEEVAGGQADESLSIAGQLPPLEWTVTLRNDRCRQILGAELPDERIDGILIGLGLEKMSVNEWKIPSFRADLTREVDLIEEIARVHGIQGIPGKSGGFAAPISDVDRLYDFQMSLKRTLAARGFSEARTLSLRPAQETTLRSENALRVRNPLTEDQTFFRESLLAGLLAVAEFNQRMGATSIRLLETGRTFLPEETLTLGLLISGQDTQGDWRKTSVPLDFFALKAEVSGLISAPLDFIAANHSAAVLAADITLSGQKIGWLGQLQPALVRDTGIKTPVYGAEIHLAALLAALPRTRLFSTLPKYPAVTRDIAFIAPQTLTHSEIEAALVGVNDPLLRDVAIFDLFTDPSGAKIPADKKSLAYSLTYRADDRTLTQDEVNTTHARLKARLVERCGVALRE